MKQLTCEMCGSTEMMKQDGVFVCQTCGTKYSVEEAKKLMIEGVVEVKGTVSIDKTDDLKNYLLRIKDFLELKNWEEAKEYCEKVLDIDPRCPEAYLYRYMSKNKIRDPKYVYITSYQKKESVYYAMNYEDFEVVESEETQDLFRFFELTTDEDYVKRIKSRLVSKKFVVEDDFITKTRYDTVGLYKEDCYLVPDFIKHIDMDESGWRTTGKHLCISKNNQCVWRDEHGVVFERCENGEVILRSATNTYGLTTYTIPDGVTHIADSAFEGCDKLEKVVFNDGLKIVGKKSFYDCKKLANITLPNSLESIGERAFCGCEELENITIPKSVEEIEEKAFFCCHRLKYIKASKYFYLSDEAFPSSAFRVRTDSESPIIDEIIKGNLLINEDKTDDAIEHFEKMILNYPKERIGYIGKAVAIFDKTSETRDTVSELLVKARNTKGSPDLENIIQDLLNKSHELIINFSEIYDSEMVNALIEMGCNPLIECMSVASKRPPQDHVEDARKIARAVLDNCWEFKYAAFKYYESFPYYTTATDPEIEKMILEKFPNVKKVQVIEPTSSTTTSSGGGCYVATAVYGSYDCPQVWTLRRYRDNILASTWCGRAFIHTYYAISPTLVKWFGHTEWFKKMWQGKLDKMVEKLQSEGVESTPYEDKNW